MYKHPGNCLIDCKPPYAGLDPTWEETFEFPVADENTTRCFVKFLMGAEGEEQQIGDECECLPAAAAACSLEFESLYLTAQLISLRSRMQSSFKQFAQERITRYPSSILFLPYWYSEF